MEMPEDEIYRKEYEKFRDDQKKYGDTKTLDEFTRVLRKRYFKELQNKLLH